MDARVAFGNHAERLLMLKEVDQSAARSKHGRYTPSLLRPLDGSGVRTKGHSL